MFVNLDLDENSEKSNDEFTESVENPVANVNDQNGNKIDVNDYDN